MGDGVEGGEGEGAREAAGEGRRAQDWKRVGAETGEGAAGGKEGAATGMGRRQVGAEKVVAGVAGVMRGAEMGRRRVGVVVGVVVRGVEVGRRRVGVTTVRGARAGAGGRATAAAAPAGDEGGWD